MRKINLNLMIGILVLIGLVIWQSRPARQHALDVRNAEPTSSAVNNLQVARLPAGVPSVAIGTKTAAPKALEPAPHAKELAVYTDLHRKVFLNERESAEKDALLKNASVLRAMGVRLMRSPGSEAAAKEQNVAVEMLLEALRTGDSEIAAEVLKGVITDGQVEDAHLDIASRENLAGVKAEVLFQWSAFRPAQANELATMLPGPVSQKIWQNIVDAQASNIAESADMDQ